MAFLLSFFFLFIITATTSAPTPQQTATFKYINQGEFGPYITENDATYRTLPIATSPFQFCFYNVTPNAFYLALRMGTARSESTRRWVWVANPFSPVHENASFELGPDGNLVLSDSDGHKVWETATSNKGIVGLNILPNGNVVLYNDGNEFVWQSFEHPSDTLLVGQSLNISGPNKLVSKNGAYSLVLERYGIMMYIDNVTSKPIKYGILSSWRKERQTSIQFQCEGEYGGVDAYELRFNEILARPKYNAVLSFLRIEDDGNLVVYTYYDPVDWEAWEKTFAYFSSELGRVDNCKLPSRCGSLGLCKDEMCVACPTKSGLLGWSENCVMPELGNCNKGKSMGFYKVEGVENFMTSFKEREGKMKLEECKRRCVSDCKCVGIFYWEAESKCWMTHMMGSLSSVSNSSHVA